MSKYIRRAIDFLQIGQLEKVAVLLEQIMVFLPILLVHTGTPCQFLEQGRTIMLVMISFQQDHLSCVFPFQLKNLLHILKEIIRQPILSKVRVKVVAQEDNFVNPVQILSHRLLPKDTPVHIRNNQDSLCHLVRNLLHVAFPNR